MTERYQINGKEEFKRVNAKTGQDFFRLLAFFKLCSIVVSYLRHHDHYPSNMITIPVIELLVRLLTWNSRPLCRFTFRASSCVRGNYPAYMKESAQMKQNK